MPQDMAVPEPADSGFYYVVVLHDDGTESLSGQRVAAPGTPAPAIGDSLAWPDIEGAIPARTKQVPHEVVEVRPASEHRFPVIVLRRRT
jgi:hypothetical protein